MSLFEFQPLKLVCSIAQVAYRFRQRRPNQMVEDCDDGGEAGAGKRLLELLVMRNDIGVFVMATCTQIWVA